MGVPRVVAHEERNAELARLIGGAYEASRGIYGSPKVHQVLRRQGVRTSRKRVARIMSEYGWRGTTRGNARRPRGTGKQAAHAPRVPDLVGGDFSAKRPNKAWFADITYVRTRQGWLYMAAVMDVWSCKVVGWSMGPRMTAELADDALRMANRPGGPAQAASTTATTAPSTRRCSCGGPCAKRASCRRWAR